jgi:hypothetical protein
MTRRLLSTLILGSMLSGCASTSLYTWGTYEDDLFKYFHDPAQKELAVEHHLDLVQKLTAADQVVAPGLYAEAGTFAFLEGDKATAVKFYALEAELWPESRPLMTVLINNLEAN